METKDYLTNYYESYDEEGRLISKHGMVKYDYKRIHRLVYRLEVKNDYT